MDVFYHDIHITFALILCNDRCLFVATAEYCTEEEEQNDIDNTLKQHRHIKQ